VQRVQEFAHDRLGKTIITAKDRAGFVVNALLIPYLVAAIRMVDAGLASADDIDTAMVAGCAHPMGPPALADPHRTRYHCGGRWIDVRGNEGAVVRTSGPVAAQVGGGRPRSEDRSGILHVSLAHPRRFPLSSERLYLTLRRGNSGVHCTRAR
jgi:hypothetical protein